MFILNIIDLSKVGRNLPFGHKLRLLVESDSSDSATPITSPASNALHNLVSGDSQYSSSSCVSFPAFRIRTEKPISALTADDIRPHLEIIKRCLNGEKFCSGIKRNEDLKIVFLALAEAVLHDDELYNLLNDSNQFSDKSELNSALINVSNGIRSPQKIGVSMRG